MKSRWYWFNYRKGDWAEQEGPPPKSFIQETFRRSLKNPNRTYCFLRIDPPAAAPRKLRVYLACGINKNGTIKKYELIDEFGTIVQGIWTSQRWADVLPRLRDDADELGLELVLNSVP